MQTRSRRLVLCLVKAARQFGSSPFSRNTTYWRKATCKNRIEWLPKRKSLGNSASHTAKKYLLQKVFLAETNVTCCIKNSEFSFQLRLSFWIEIIKKRLACWIYLLKTTNYYYYTILSGTVYKHLHNESFIPRKELCPQVRWILDPTLFSCAFMMGHQRCCTKFL